MFEGFDLKTDETYIDDPLTDEKLNAVEEKLGHELPQPEFQQ